MSCEPERVTGYVDVELSPPDLEAIVLACLAKDPDARPRSADELMARLDRVRLEREWTPARSRQWWDEHRPVPHV